MNDPAGVAFIGAGFISYLHLMSVRAHPRARLVALATRSEDVAKHRARIFNVDGYPFYDLDKMLGREDIDIVYVQSPNFVHAEHALAVIKAGKHLIVEMPMVLTLADADKVVSAADSANVGIGYAENQVFAPMMEKARELVDHGAVGNVERVIGFCGHSGPSKTGWFWLPELSGGGANIDLGPHTLESALYLAGKPPIVRVKSAQLTKAEHVGIDTRAEMILESENGIEISITSSWIEEQDSFYYEVHGDKGKIGCVFEPAPQFLTLDPVDDPTEDIDFPGRFNMRLDVLLGSSGYATQLIHFEECFRNGTKPRESGEDGRNVLRILSAGYLSAAMDTSVELASNMPVDKTPVQLWLGG